VGGRAGAGIPVVVRVVSKQGGAGGRGLKGQEGDYEQQRSRARELEAVVVVISGPLYAPGGLAGLHVR
jgi:hypothetical protein